MRLIKKARGFSLVELIIVMSIITVLLTLAVPMLSVKERMDQTNYDTRGLANIAQAAKLFYVEEGQVWPATVDDLMPDYLPNFQNRNISGNPFVLALSGTGMTISSEYNDPGLPRSIAADWGADATVAGNIITVGIVVPGEEASHLALSDRAGTRPYLGTVEFEPGADIDLQENELLNAGRVNARTAALTGTVDADLVNGDSVTADQFVYNEE